MKNYNFNYIKKNIFFKKKLGQNFLIDINIIKKIVYLSNINKKDNIIEVGSGTGLLTKELSKGSKIVFSFEIDKRFFNILLKKFYNNKDYSNIILINFDILKFKLNNNFFKKNIKKNKKIKFKLISNLPYYISIPIIIKFLKSELYIEEMILMVQKEIGEKIMANVGEKLYGYISIIIQYYMNIKKMFNVSRNVFFPKPNVDSIVIKLVRKYREKKVLNIKNFNNLVKISFKYKRKTLFNNLIFYNNNYEFKKKLLKKMRFLKINPNIRSNYLTVEKFIELSNILKLNF